MFSKLQLALLLGVGVSLARISWGKKQAYSNLRSAALMEIAQEVQSRRSPATSWRRHYLKKRGSLPTNCSLKRSTRVC
jgi:hypothetical protein